MIFYLSCTGNTRWAAEQIANALNDRLVFMPQATNQTFTLAENEPIGFCFPVHGWRPPLLVRNFIQQLRLQRNGSHYCFALCTAGDNIGETMKLLASDLQTIDLTLDCTCSLIMPESYVGLPFMDVDTLENERKKKTQAAKDLAQFIEIVKHKQHADGTLHVGRWPRINSRLIGGFFVKHLITDAPFHVNADRCIRCGLCADVCPVENIKGGRNQMPVWQHSGACLSCFNCYHHCPRHAIEYGSRTKNKGQYYYLKNADS